MKSIMQICILHQNKLKLNSFYLLNKMQKQTIYRGAFF
jgi:hypothetical protein